MRRQYIMSIGVSVNTFDIEEFGKQSIFTLSFQNQGDVFKGINIGDKILGYVKQPIHKIRYIFEVAEVIEDNKLNLIKKLDIQFGLDKSEFLDIVDVDILEQKCEIIEICQEVYIKIYNKIIYLLQDSIIDIDYLFKLENKSFALEAINIVKNIDGFKEETLRILLDKDECKKYLRIHILY